MSWFKPKASQKDFEHLVKVTQTQKAEIIRLEGKIQALDTALSHIRIKVTELGAYPNRPLAGSNVKHQVGTTPQHYTGHAKVTQHYSDSSPDLSTVMLVSALASDSGPSHSSSCDSYSSSSCDSSSSCGGE